ncbi:ribosomal protein L15 [Halorhabdus utahensis DSM 12940]|uniref:Large ribosomal subunit protein uL15 n=1 Tax=Halorhabdus utahensis (strain DSM 12940 / JCM 11049 / AX-2) TaxID=519442 RepID=C7NV69_HALUD|nr:uL15m family ribosomal protein [Halorhabdus utahensis]ACV12481.1 ribosomal protein L15 [Halorhabdus utahensis DSM 12940]
MTDKSKRQRGSRTHGGGTHKNRRGAGHRGGRGDAGRDKHEMHNHPPIGKSGFTRPEKAQDDVATVEVKTLDEDAALLAADGVAEQTDGGYEIDARDVVEDGHEVDVVKVLGGGQVRNELTIVADAFSDGAREKIEAAGGTTELSDRGEQRQDKDDADTDTA